MISKDKWLSLRAVCRSKTGGFYLSLNQKGSERERWRREKFWACGDPKRDVGTVKEG